jgi:UDP-glucose 4-epimerase
MMKSVLITGGFGYIGGRIAKEIASNSTWQVRLGSRVPRKAPDWLPQAEVVTLDVLDDDSLLRAVQDVQAVIHLAAMNEHQCGADPQKAIEVNTQGTVKMLQASISVGVERFIYFSTAHVYAAPLQGHITEQTLVRPIHPYAITHRAAEDFVLAAHDQCQITGIVVRLSNGFGAPTHVDVDRWTLLVNDLCRQAVQTRKMVLRSSGLQQRDFITLSDTARATVHLLDLSQANCGQGLFNLGGEASLSVWQMTQRIAERCQAVLGFRPEIIRPEFDRNERSPELDYSIDLLKETGFHPLSDIDNELDHMLLFCRDSFGE